MIAIVLIALAAGCASALMFASTMSGVPVSLLLSIMAPLPLMVAALGWGPLAATIGGIAAASGFGIFFGMRYCIAFAIAVALPAWWLGHLALLGRPVTNTAPGNGSAPAAPQLEWYPLGRILLWIAGFAMSCCRHVAGVRQGRRCHRRSASKRAAAGPSCARGPVDR